MKKGKGKAAKKAMKFAERRPKAEKWVASYDGTLYGGDIVKAYRKKFAVDRMKAAIRRVFDKRTDRQGEGRCKSVPGNTEGKKSKKEKNPGTEEDGEG